MRERIESSHAGPLTDPGLNTLPTYLPSLGEGHPTIGTFSSDPSNPSLGEGHPAGITVLDMDVWQNTMDHPPRQPG